MPGVQRNSRERGRHKQIVTDICEAIGIDISEEEISVSHRLPSKPRPDHRSDDRTKVIVARLVRRDIRD